ncbi:efflux RND transporter permease subunit [Actinocorallia populi]|uniref:efflux RND transporter permease subunit n=1 Tax=Actinocorallia populi TaxID=2079200 RepID=UPI000D08E60F|nr:efflux RND transporter permease subunit [Actinocorallia populi]
MSWLSKISLAHRKLVMLITLGLLALGAYAIPTLQQQLLPNISVPATLVMAPYPGASPEVVEEQVVEPIESAVKNIDGLESMTATSRQGMATVALTFEFGTGTDTLLTEVRQAVNRVSGRLPAGVTPEVMTFSTDDLPTMTLAVTSSGQGGLDGLAAAVEAKVAPELRSVDGVNEVTVSGEREQIVQIVPNPAKLAASGLDASAIGTALGTAGRTVPGGSITSGEQSLSVQIGGPITSVQQIKDLWLTGSKTPVKLGSVAAVALADAESTSLTRTNGKESLGLSLMLERDGSSSSVSGDVRDLLPGLEKSLGAGAEITIVSDTGPAVSDAVLGLLEEGLLGLVMAVLVIVLFLRSARSTLVTAISIPLSLVVALIVLKFNGYSLNMLTLGGLTIAVGRVVDDSIVVLENIKRHLGYGEEKRQAIIGAVREVAGAVTSSTLTTVAVFLPIALVGGMVGELFGSFSIAVTVAMIASLVVSLTIIPVLAYWFLKTPDVGADPEVFRRRAEEAERTGLLQLVYVPLIGWAVRFRKTVLAGAVLVLVLTGVLAAGLKTDFLGDSGTQALSVTQTMPAGTALNTTDAASRKVELVLERTEGVESYQVVVGSPGGIMGALMSGGSSEATYNVALAEDADSERVQAALEDDLKALTGAGEIKVAANTGMGASGLVEVRVDAPDDVSRAAAVKQLQDALSTVPEVKDVSSDLAESVPMLSVRAKDSAARMGLSDTVLAQVVAQAVQGSTVTTVNLERGETDVVVRASAGAPASVEELKALRVPGVPGGAVRLSQVATVAQVDGPVERTRQDGESTSTVTAVPVGDDLAKASQAIQKKLDSLKPADGVTYTLGGVTADQEEAFAQLGLAIAAAILIVFLLLVAAFGSIRQTLVLLVSVPFAATGAIILLLITGVPMGVAAMIGMLMLVGIVVTNAIVLVDLVNQYREQGMSVQDAVIEGGRRRLRPILMTALATIFALIPMALGLTASGGFISQPLAVVVIGGLISSTALTLVLIPVLYTMVETRREARQARKAAQADQKATGDEDSEPSEDLQPVS